MKATVGERGQITIPKPLRDRLGIRPGMEVELSEEPGRLVLRKADVLERIRQTVGAMETGMTTDEFIELVRGPAELPANDR
jgi:AbrB family looped-hinge helix DNA binding protein